MATQVAVTWEDQQKINLFGRYHTRCGELDQEIELMEKEIEQMKDCLAEIENLLDDDGAVKVKLGQIYFDVNNEKGLELVNQEIAKKEKLISEKQEQKTSMQEKLAELKAELYKKFGESIQLE
eukprot:UN02225